MLSQGIKKCNVSRNSLPSIKRFYPVGKQTVDVSTTQLFCGEFCN